MLPGFDWKTLACSHHQVCGFLLHMSTVVLVYSPHRLLFMYKSAKSLTIMAKSVDVLGCRFCLICCPVKRKLLSVNLLFFRISILGELRFVHHQRSGDIFLLTLQEIKKKKVLAFWSVYIFSKRVQTIASRLMYQPKAIWSPFSLDIWICPETLPVSSIWSAASYSLQPQSGTTYSTYLLCFLFFDLFSDTDSQTPNVIIVEALVYFLLVRKKPCKDRGVISLSQ